MNPPNTAPANAGPTPERLMQLAWGYAAPLIVETAVETKVFDHLDSGPRTLDELATTTGASARGLRAILDALVGIQLLARNGDRYALTPESSAFLVSGKQPFYGGFFRHISAHLIPRWLPLTKIVRSGRPADGPNDQAQAAELFADFVESLFPLSYGTARQLGEHLGVPATREPISVLDLGAGSGVWGIALAQQSPHVQIRAVDWPRVLEVTQRVAQRCGVADRLTLAPGDLLEADFGHGHQIATIGHILHGNGPEQNQRLLRRVYDALAPGGTVAIMEFVVSEDRTGPPIALLFAVNMLINTQAGDTYTFSQMSAWLREAGFVNPRQVEVKGVSPLVLATRP